MDKYYAAFILIFMGFLFGIISFIASNSPSEVVQEWKNESNTLILSVNTNGINYGSWPPNQYHHFFLSTFINGKATNRGTFIMISNEFSDYKNLKVEWLEDGCLITSKNGYKIFMPYP